jgi:hypothetical protein
MICISCLQDSYGVDILQSNTEKQDETTMEKKVGIWDLSLS